MSTHTIGYIHTVALMVHQGSKEYKCTVCKVIKPGLVNVHCVWSIWHAQCETCTCTYLLSIVFLWIIMSLMWMVYTRKRDIIMSPSESLSTTVPSIIAIPQSINPTGTQHVVILLPPPVGFIASGLPDNHNFVICLSWLFLLQLGAALSSSSSSPSEQLEKYLWTWRTWSELLHANASVRCFSFLF